MLLAERIKNCWQIIQNNNTIALQRERIQVNVDLFVFFFMVVVVLVVVVSKKELELTMVRINKTFASIQTGFELCGINEYDSDVSR